MVKKTNSKADTRAKLINLALRKRGSKALSPRPGGVLGAKTFPKNGKPLHGLPPGRGLGAFCVRTEQPYIDPALRKRGWTAATCFASRHP